MIIERLDDNFGTRYTLETTGTYNFTISRNNTKSYGLTGTYHIRYGPGYGSLTDEQMQELFMAWQAMRQEYITGEDINYDTSA